MGGHHGDHGGHVPERATGERCIDSGTAPTPPLSMEVCTATDRRSRPHTAPNRTAVSKKSFTVYTQLNKKRIPFMYTDRGDNGLKVCHV